MTSVLKNTNPSPEDIEKLNQFFFVRWLSSDARSIGIANFLNRFYKEVPTKNQYYLTKQVLSGRIKWINIPKKSQDYGKVIENICRFYKINEETALEYYEMFSENKRRYFKDLYPD
jgi:hypothetical protein